MSRIEVRKCDLSSCNATTPVDNSTGWLLYTHEGRQFDFCNPDHLQDWLAEQSQPVLEELET